MHDFSSFSDELKKGEQTWFTKRLAQVLDFTLKPWCDNCSHSAAEAGERLCVHAYEVTLLSVYHKEHQVLLPIELPYGLRMSQLLDSLWRVLEALSKLVGARWRSHPLEGDHIAQAIFQHMRDFTLAEAHADAEEMLRDLRGCVVQ